LVDIYKQKKAYSRKNASNHMSEKLADCSKKGILILYMHKLLKKLMLLLTKYILSFD